MIRLFKVDDDTLYFIDDNKNIIIKKIKVLENPHRAITLNIGDSLEKVMARIIELGYLLDE